MNNTLAATDQRHRAVVNVIWEAPCGLQLSGVYFYGSAMRFSTSVGGDSRGQTTAGENRYRTGSTAVEPAATIESSASYGLPAFNNNVSYRPRALQIGFRIQF